MSGQASSAAELILGLRTALHDIHANPYPEVPNPPDCKRRAAVACIIRVRPTFPDVATNDHLTLSEGAAFDETLSSFFDQAWVKDGEPEVLFIRRAARQGDRWTSQVALPGGKRDPEDVSDQATSMRETLEEVGLDLSSEYTLHAGNLAERIVATEWGTVPLMVLCPYVFLLMRHDLAPLQLQPAEIESAHWVSIRALLSPAMRTYETANVSDRFARRGGWLLKRTLRALLGHMLFGAVRLIPTESLYSSSVPGFIPANARPSASSRVFGSVSSFLLGRHTPPSGVDRPLLLWGLTHGIIGDLLDHIPGQQTIAWWQWPTLSAPDVRFAVWLVSYVFRKRKLAGQQQASEGPLTIIEEGFASVRTGSASQTLGSGPKPTFPRASRHGSIVHMLDGYFPLIQRGVFVAMTLRLGVGAAAVAYAAHRLSQRSLRTRELAK